MEAEQKRALIEAIESLPAEKQQEVVAYVDRLLEGQKEEQSASKNGGIDLQELRGALSHLKDEYTVEELEEKAKEWWVKQAMDY